MNVIADYKGRERWLRERLRPSVEQRTAAFTIEQICDRMQLAMAEPGKRQKSGRNDPFVTGELGRGNPVTFDLTGYRHRQFLRFFDPNKILKPHMIGTLVSEGDETSMTYSFDVRKAARRFYLLMTLSLLLGVAAAIFAATIGFAVPGVGFFALISAGVTFAYARNIWTAIPDSILDEKYLEEWMALQSN